MVIDEVAVSWLLWSPFRSHGNLFWRVLYFFVPSISLSRRRCDNWRRFRRAPGLYWTTLPQVSTRWARCISCYILVF